MKTLFSPLQEFLKKGDMLLLSLCLLASGFGVALIFSATRYNDNNKEVAVQIVAILLGILVYILCTYVDFESFVEKNWKWLLGFSIIFLLLLLTPFGVTRGGNRNWLQFPGFPILIQPNEVVKIPYILLLAMQIHKLQERGHDIGSVFSVAQIGAHAAFMLALIAGICGDMGMCVVYTMIFSIMSWSAGVKLRWFVLVGSAIVIAFVILWFFVLPKTEAWDKLYLIKRFRVLFDHSYDPQGVGFQQTRSVLAIGSGQIFGKGYLQGSMTQSAYESTLPARDTDFIFAVCGEELGMVGCLALLALLSAVVLRCISGSPPRQLSLLRLRIHGYGWYAHRSDRRQCRVCACLSSPLWALPPLHQLWRLLHHHPLHRHGHRLQHPGQDPPQLASGPEPALTLADPRSRR